MTGDDLKIRFFGCEGEWSPVAGPRGRLVETGELGSTDGLSVGRVHPIHM
jgi:hypothetical protein